MSVPVADLILVRPMRLLAAICILLGGCATTERILPALPVATRVDVADYNSRLMKRIATPARVSAIIELVDAQHSWHPPSSETPVGSFHVTLYSGSRSVEFLDYGPGWLVRGFQQRPHYTSLSRSDDDRLLRLLGLRRTDFR